MSHRYTLLLGGTIFPAEDAPPASAIAWAEGFVLAIGSDESVRGISRGDSTFIDLGGRYVVPLGPDGGPAWPPLGRLELGGSADLAVLSSDPRAGGPLEPVAVVRGGQVVSGSLEGARGAAIRNRSVPDAVVIPVLAYPEVHGPSRWLVEGLGFRIRLRIADHRIQLVCGSGAVVVTSRGGAADLGGGDAVLLRVRDVDATFARAIEAGATEVSPPADQPYGERQASITDPWGHAWTLSESIFDADPAAWGGEAVDLDDDDEPGAR